MYINSIDSNRTLRAVERILSHNINDAYIPSHHSKVANFLSGTAVGKPKMPEVKKFITPAPAAASLNLIYDSKVLNLQLDSIAFTGNKEEGNSYLANSVREGDNGEHIPSNSPMYE